MTTRAEAIEKAAHALVAQWEADYEGCVTIDALCSALALPPSPATADERAEAIEAMLIGIGETFDTAIAERENRGGQHTNGGHEWQGVGPGHLANMRRWSRDFRRVLAMPALSPAARWAAEPDRDTLRTAAQRVVDAQYPGDMADPPDLAETRAILRAQVVALRALPVDADAIAVLSAVAL